MHKQNYRHIQTKVHRRHRSTQQMGAMQNKIKRNSQSYSKNKQQQKQNKVIDLRSRLDIIEQSLSTQPHNKELQTEMTKHKTDLEVHAMAQAHGTQTRARLKFIEEGLSLIHI
eukprot:TRINITY_DN45049_c0_g1_i4.p2 TRINITY_DN45049_c0_g1~~TRINITY_DN45049_c0_g1_i4.p2  ORF type:complete len:113 (-),score=20.32 TRINITY_DN45049_c0_g1_i4:29-367(-)